MIRNIDGAPLSHPLPHFTFFVVTSTSELISIVRRLLLLSGVRCDDFYAHHSHLYGMPLFCHFYTKLGLYDSTHCSTWG